MITLLSSDFDAKSKELLVFSQKRGGKPEGSLLMARDLQFAWSFECFYSKYSSFESPDFLKEGVRERVYYAQSNQDSQSYDKKSLKRELFS